MKQCTGPIGAGCSHIYRRIYRYNPEIHGDLYLYNIYLNTYLLENTCILIAIQIFCHRPKCYCCFCLIQIQGQLFYTITRCAYIQGELNRGKNCNLSYAHVFYLIKINTPDSVLVYILYGRSWGYTVVIWSNQTRTVLSVEKHGY
jgi:hypothetical protein